MYEPTPIKSPPVAILILLIVLVPFIFKQPLCNTDITLLLLAFTDTDWPFQPTQSALK